MLEDLFMTELKELEDEHEKKRNQAYNNMVQSLAALENSLSPQVDDAMDTIIDQQQQIQDICLDIAKHQVMRHQRVIRWKAELKRYNFQMAELNLFERWLEQVETNMHLICSKLEYVCHELSKGDDNGI